MNTKKHGLSKHSIYKRWASMVQRCTNPKNGAFKNYGGRGINIDSRWLEFENFFSDMGLPDEGMTLERVDNNKGYSKGNCVWADRKRQSQNRRNVTKHELNGECKSLVDWADFYGIGIATLWARIKSGMTLDQAVIKPVFRSRSKVFVFEGKETNLYELSKTFGIKPSTIYGRLQRNFDLESAVKKPLNKHLSTFIRTRSDA